jgi:hypothetical protein
MPAKCTKHPEYKAIYAPRCNCVDCWKIYAEKLEEKLKSYGKGGKVFNG